jgi:hypothetical protein
LVCAALVGARGGGGSISAADLGAESAKASYAGGAGLDAVQACKDALKGTVTDGAACANGNECVSGHCDIPSGASSGLCSTPPAIGQPCTDVCADGAVCTYNDQQMLVCTALKADGTACAQDYECLHDNCMGADPQTMTMGTCAASTTCDGM